MPSIRAVASLVFTACAAFGQPAATFEVTSVKPSPPWHPGSDGGVHLDGARFSSTRIPVRNLIYSAYGVPSWTVSGGPAWLDSDPYDIVATLPPNTQQAFLLLIRERLARTGYQQNWAEFAAGNADLLNWKDNVLKKYYRVETLSSDLARTTFLFPDKAGSEP